MSSRSYQTGKHLEAFILLLLAKEPQHGGAIMSQLKAMLPPEWTLDDGRVYRVLRSLEAEGAVTSDWVTEAVGAPVRVYQLTPMGHERLAAWRDDIALRVQSLHTFLDLWEVYTSANARESR